MNKYQRILAFWGLILLSGCHSRSDDVKEQMAKIQHQATLPVESNPTLVPAPIFEYSVYQLRSPFVPHSLANALQRRTYTKMDLNVSRPREELENYSLESLRMKGSFKTIEGNPFALIQTPDQTLKRVRLGSYMGHNHGRVIKIQPKSIDLIEMIANGDDGYIERSRRLILSDNF
ncbi:MULTISPECIES: pilus assembly protein PilP [unclassified Acinetobacter]|uniref:pilus assembly protein PilP n=1 Tax=unclassified Acinetobacter TaxID=196816 RepID=UPI002934CA28|nr:MULTISPECIES: pilus assembly protein PilP [unclassified Acinetobacter]WOE31068.1 pilus assembly protein PilP [Acinetobacter sp. SAAs470]WOE39264.1 pilus assembly protein PilP [Acinetobacter sp. SAAs474]